MGSSPDGEDLAAPTADHVFVGLDAALAESGDAQQGFSTACLASPAWPVRRWVISAGAPG